MKSKVLSLLSDTNYVSGESISETLGISRAAVWKHINALKNDGYTIESSTNKGYIITSHPDLLTYNEIQPYLETRFIGRNILHYASINSTNNRVKEAAGENYSEGLTVVSEEQTSGRGRLGRTWVSPKGKGIYMSILLRPHISPMDAYKVTVIGAAAVHKTLFQAGIHSLIKWPNDIVISGKKICGILTEMSAELNKIHYLVIGIGLNINADTDDIPCEIKNKASSLKIEIGQELSRKKIMAGILNNFEKLYSEFISTNSIESSILICREYSAVLGKEILLLEANKTTEVTALDINPEGHLIVKAGSEIKEIMSGEVSLRGKDGYI